MKEVRVKSVEYLMRGSRLKVEVVTYEATGDSPTWNPPIAAPARFLIPEQQSCREISANLW